MLTLYVKTGCPFCGAVLRVLEAEGIPYTEKNVADPEVVEELVSLGGRRQVPFLVDSDTDIQMYESGMIIDYLNEHYATHRHETVVQERGCTDC